MWPLLTHSSGTCAADCSGHTAALLDAPVSSELQMLPWDPLTDGTDSWTAVLYMQSQKHATEIRRGFLEEVPRTCQAVTFCIGAWIRKDGTEQDTTDG